MPFTASDAANHTKQAVTNDEKKFWAARANAALGATGDDVTAVKIANAALRDFVRSGRKVRDPED